MSATAILGLVAIKQLKKLQGNASQLQDFKKMERKKLIVDMEKITNIATWLKLVYVHAKL